MLSVAMYACRFARSRRRPPFEGRVPGGPFKKTETHPSPHQMAWPRARQGRLP